MAVTGSPNAGNFNGSPIRKKHGDKARQPRRVRRSRNRSSSIAVRKGHTFKQTGEMREVRVAVQNDQAQRTVMLPTVEVEGGSWAKMRGGYYARRMKFTPATVYPACYTAPSFASEIVAKRKSRTDAKGTGEAKEPEVRLSNKHTAAAPICSPLDGATESLNRNEWTVLSITRQGNRKGAAPYVVRAKQGKYVKIIAIRKALNMTDCKAQLATIHGITA